eukprot:c19185_g1_i2.p1 GENE.c19185_g1_i2~~c19185_g1_i2.p1  ORF type:complete len:762 (+),score=189.71 c19185_g1_i2:205-2286(+)
MSDDEPVKPSPPKGWMQQSAFSQSWASVPDVEDEAVDWLVDTIMVTAKAYETGKCQPTKPNLASCSLANKLPPALLQQLQALSEVVTFKSGDVIIRQGDPGDSFFIIVSGTVSVIANETRKRTELSPRTSPLPPPRKVSNNTNRASIRLSGKLGDDGSVLKDLTYRYAGDFFGQLSLLYGSARSATITAVEDTTCAVLSKHNFDKCKDLRLFLTIMFVPMFSDLTGAEEVELVSRVHFARFGHNDVVLREGESITSESSFFVIVAGEADVVDSEFGILTRLHQGHTFGELGIVDLNPRTATVRVVSESLLCVRFTKADYDEVIPEHVKAKIRRQADSVKRTRLARKEAKARAALVVPTPFNAPTKPTFGGDNYVEEVPQLRRWRTTEGDRMINDYKIVNEIGRGSYGTVYKCSKEWTGSGVLPSLSLDTEEQFFAVKVVTRSELGKSRLRSGVEQGPSEFVEAHIMKTLLHPNIVRLFEIIDDPTEDKFIIVMEYVEGGSAMKYVNQRRGPDGTVDTDIIRSLFRQIVRALEYLHASGIVHCDIKPDNILVDETTGHIKLCDFGVSRKVNSTSTIGSRGTPAFMAPELIIDEEAVFTPTIDMWALGATLYMLITGNVPFSVQNELQLEHHVTHDEVDFPPTLHIDAHLKNLIKNRLLDRDPETRASLEEVMLDEWVTNEGTQAMPPCSFQPQF